MSKEARGVLKWSGELRGDVRAMNRGRGLTIRIHVSSGRLCRARPASARWPPAFPLPVRGVSLERARAAGEKSLPRLGPGRSSSR